MEIMISSTIMLLFLGGVYQVFFNTMLTTKAGTSQAQYNLEGMLLQQRITREIEQSKFAVVSTWFRTNDYIQLYKPDADDGGYIRTDYLVYYYDNRLWKRVLDGVMYSSWQPIQNSVWPLGDDRDPPFEIINRTVHVNLLVGDSTNTEDYYETGPGYQGLEIQFSAMPRNLQVWYD